MHSVYTVTEIDATLRDNPSAQQGEYEIARWAFGAESLSQALRIVKQTIGERDLSALRDANGRVVGFEQWGSRYRDLDGYKCDQVRQWRIA
jgi:hypothetical protein